MTSSSAQPPTTGRDRRRAQERTGDEYESFLRSVTLVDWLVLLLVVLYLLVSREPPPSLALTAGAIVGFAGFLLAFRSKRFPLRSPVQRIALDVFVTVVFLTVVVTQAGGADSPLVNLYLLPLVLCAVTLRARVTLLAFLLVAGAVLLLHLVAPGERHGLQMIVAHLLGELGPFGLVTPANCPRFPETTDRSPRSPRAGPSAPASPSPPAATRPSACAGFRPALSCRTPAAR